MFQKKNPPKPRFPCRTAAVPLGTTRLSIELKQNGKTQRYIPAVLCSSLDHWRCFFFFLLFSLIEARQKVPRAPVSLRFGITGCCSPSAGAAVAYGKYLFSKFFENFSFFSSSFPPCSPSPPLALVAALRLHGAIPTMKIDSSDLLLSLSLFWVPRTHCCTSLTESH